ncbi:lipoyl(octanoyl) transferase LipB [Chitinophaga sancti]|uniref:Octanoyltransferase n=1 Tax=Chitinophaga sancti TaxID=1004 RepID=A0A1K1PUU7_9BACT|nr:lipoyl(octanoyl) transferase LipB [Chitinophaga sancti]WQD61613.1 lipoyl(octanoyl) transferase LipB [Chitinophaga sancti]WQG92830.1 lipoyl(octanoyl) transferase LipB [Chitinophaga sancti]SFW51305.1 lipoyl(octanoyl) transferase [Chitinophaga sancti]
MTNRTIHIQDLGVIAYQPAWDYQEQLLQENVRIKQAKGRGELPADSAVTTNHFLFCEHPPVYTLGKSGHMENLLLNEAQLVDKGITFVPTNRGGDITYHGPGQVVGYPILDLEHFFTDIGKYLRLLEEVVIRTLADYGIKGDRSPGETGVWLDPGDPKKARKICAMGVRCSRWITMHGFALNVNTDLNYFSNIIPCGIVDKKVAAMQEELGREIPLAEVKEKLLKHFAEVFDAVIA